MKMIVISDTHMPKMAKKIPEALKKGLTDADLILHAGDWQTAEVYDELRKYAPVEGVTGNIDEEGLHKLFDRKKILHFGEVKIGITHGDGKGKTTEKRAMDVFKDDDIDILIYGHSHIPVLKTNDKPILFNPGSPTDKRRQQHYSYGVIEIEKTVSIEHVFFDNKE
ncbi:metallophosphoesterase family protein [Jeotgalibacillus soli]|uniref:Phosphoesterase n=1 Tax=Jeotgalibacillus soli TaxID=889306 RepID=A0A0C2VSH5_9BACL|nr:metallophosphoesterase [Jeotgalibacillus soli]KIL51877.1 hypothetical protein KP78_02470 [Jeotgalibacillus soli]